MGPQAAACCWPAGEKFYIVTFTHLPTVTAYGDHTVQYDIQGCSTQKGRILYNRSTRDAALYCWCVRYAGAVQRMSVGHEIQGPKVIKLCYRTSISVPSSHRGPNAPTRARPPMTGLGPRLLLRLVVALHAQLPPRAPLEMAHAQLWKTKPLMLQLPFRWHSPPPS